MTAVVPPRTAGIVSRAIAGVIDVLVAAAIIVGAVLALNFFLFVVDIRRIEVDGLRWWFTTSGYVAVLALYLFACWATSGRTIGCVAMGLRVTGAGGDRLNAVSAAIRAVLCALFPIGLAWVVLSPSRRSVQDILVRSAVVYTHAAAV
ncbi:RDD family protein [Gordonia sp. X0973]|uniref:RDD family protein n=1 Tax=Gordonia sp. X0973 TaxID=2742602 RepID=UPI000F54ACA7|nr:RDD family protein [Gordonia sp. X0973]QKT06414.1 RDD family protein [Gordonia sp. X0973]